MTVETRQTNIRLFFVSLDVLNSRFMCSKVKKRMVVNAETLSDKDCLKAEW